MDYAAVPPEINSGRMYSGPGSTPLLAAAMAWNLLANDLHSAAAGYRDQIADLVADAWRGQAANSMNAAAATHVTWLVTTAAQAQSTAEQARAAAEAYDAAFCSTVPPVMITANRSQLTSLVATNVLGQNASAIAATEAQYAEMWAQDATTMYEYAVASSAATQLTPFSTPTASAHDDQSGSQNDSNIPQLTSLIKAIPSALQHFTSQLQATPASDVPAGVAGLLANLGLTTPVTFLNPLNSALTVVSLGGSYWAWGTAVQTDTELLSAQQQIGDTENQILERLETRAVPPPTTAATLSAASARAAAVGGLSVPQGWVAQAPAMRLAALTSPPPMASALLTEASSASLTPFSATDLAAAALLRRSAGTPTPQTLSGQPMSSPGKRPTVLPAAWGGSA